MDESTFLNPAKAVRAAGVHEGHVVADFGAGSGFFTRAAARVVGDSGVVWAVDAHADMLSRIQNLAAGEGLHNVQVVRGDLEREGGSNLPPNTFDFCIVANLLFSVENKQAVITEARRILKKNGRVLVVDWAGSFGGLGPHPDHVFGAAAAKKLFEDGGFSVLDEVPAGEYHWGFVVRKKSAADAH